MDLRCFISVNLPESVRKAISSLIDELKKAGADIRWTAADNLHLTLKFLGNIDPMLIEKMTERLQKKLASYNTFYIKIAGTGCFPSEKKPRVVWVGIHDPETLRDLWADVESAMSELGFAAENRPFSPHLTIGRVKSMKRVPEMMKRFNAFRETAFGTVEVKGIHIMKSELKPAGAVHSCLAEIPVRKREE